MWSLVSCDKTFKETDITMNGFQRPAPKTRDSIKNFCKSIDCEVGAQTINSIIE